MLLLNREEIKKVFSMKDAIEADKLCYRMNSEGKFEVPLRPVISTDKGNFCFMPSYCSELNAAACKIVNIFPGNGALGLPGSIGQVMLFDGDTGEARALLDGTYVTAVRTAAASGAAFDLWGLKDARIGALIGTGSQAMSQLEAMLTARKLDEVRVAARNFDKTQAFVERARKEFAGYETEIIACDDTNKAVDGADLVTLVTVATEPVCSAEYFKPGAVISCVGAYQYEMQELDPKVFDKCGKIYFDNMEAVLSESGDILKPLDAGTLSREQFTGDIGDYLLGRIPGREADDEIIVYENVGFGALDLVAAVEITAKAEELGMGTEWK